MKIRDIVTEVGNHYAKLKDDEYNQDPYYGKDIVWMGEKGRMIMLTPQNSEPMWGNTFDGAKIRETAIAIKNHDGKVKFNAPLVTVRIIEIQDIIDNIKSDEHGDLMFDPAIDGNHRFTTGDRNLDKYIIDPDQYLDDESYDDEHREELMAEMEETLKDAIEEKWGDIGKAFMTVRDGNHRRCAAFRAGEEFIWGMVTSNDLQSKNFAGSLK